MPGRIWIPPDCNRPIRKRRHSEKSTNNSRELTILRCSGGVLSSRCYIPLGKRPNFRNPAKSRRPQRPGRIWTSPYYNPHLGKRRNSGKFKKNSRRLIPRLCLGGVLSSRRYIPPLGKRPNFRNSEEIRYPGCQGGYGFPIL